MNLKYRLEIANMAHKILGSAPGKYVPHNIHGSVSVFDLDGTLAQGGLWWRTMPRKWAKEMVDFERMIGPVVYLTCRPSWMHESSKRWLKQHGFPEGEVICMPGKWQVFTSLAQRVAFKWTVLDILRSRGVRVRAAYGNSPCDKLAYTYANIDIDRIHMVREGAL